MKLYTTLVPAAFLVLGAAACVTVLGLRGGSEPTAVAAPAPDSTEVVDRLDPTMDVPHPKGYYARYINRVWPCIYDCIGQCDHLVYLTTFWVEENDHPMAGQDAWLWVEPPADLSCYAGLYEPDDEACVYIDGDAQLVTDPEGCRLTVIGAYSDEDDCGCP